MLDKQIIDSLSKNVRQGWKSVRGHNDNPIKFTYILKDKDSETFKIGRTINLRRRISVIRNTDYFHRLNYFLIAFIPCDIEEYVQNTIIAAGGIPYRKRGKTGVIPKEMFALSNEDIDFVIDAFHFCRVNDGMIPSIEISVDGEYDAGFFRYNILSWENPPRKRYGIKSNIY